MSEYLGKWIKENAADGGLDCIEIIEVDSQLGIARAVGRNINISELTSQWRRDKGELGDPFSAKKIVIDDPSMIDDSAMTDIVEDTNTFEKKLVDTAGAMSDNTAQKSVYQDVAFTSSESIAHQFVRSAMELSPDKSTIVIPVSYNIHFDLHKLINIANTMNISKDAIVEVLLADMKTNPMQFVDDIELALRKIVNEPDVSSK